MTLTRNQKIGLGVGALVLATVSGVFAKNKIDMNSDKEFDLYVSKVIEFEGGLTDDPNDLGGLTKYGIAQKYYPNVDIRNLTIEDAKKIYYKDYWLSTKCYLVSRHIRFLYFDSVVIPGRGFSIRTLQKLANVKQDGILGPITAAASAKVSAQIFTNEKWAYFQQRAVDRPADKTHLNGWKSRCDKSLAYQNYLNSFA